MAYAFLMEFVMKAILTRLIQDEAGATSIEYAVIASVISVFCLAVPQIIGTKLVIKFTSISSALN